MTIVLAVPVAGVIFYFYGIAHAGAFLHGVSTGILSFASAALTVSLIPVSSTMPGVAVWASSFVLRYGFVAVALGVPAYLDLWPVAAMLAGFVGVYLVGNTVLLPVVIKAMSGPGRGEEEVERRAEV